MSGYRENLLPLIDSWKQSKARVAVFGTGQHTDLLFEVVPELSKADIVGYLDSNPTIQNTPYRGAAVHAPRWADENADVVLCSSYSNELAQAHLMNQCKAKVVISHFPQAAAVQVKQAAPVVTAHQRPGIFVPLDHADVLTAPSRDREPFKPIEDLMNAQYCEMKSFISPVMRHFDGLSGIPNEQVDMVTPFWNNGYFTGDDARVAYSMVREHKPRRIVEIGCGNSTKFLRRAIQDSGTFTELISIDPQPRSPIDELCDRRIRAGLQSIPLSFFDCLEAGDILFYDGSHVLFQGSDCAYFYLRLLPLLRKRVHVHIHDIALPYAYPEVFDDRYYNEQHILAAFLLGNNAWRVRIPVNYLHVRGDLTDGGVSFWMQRVDD